MFSHRESIYKDNIGKDNIYAKAYMEKRKIMPWKNIISKISEDVIEFILCWSCTSAYVVCA